MDAKNLVAKSNKKNIFYNALSGMLLPIVNGLIGMLLTRQIILQFGSDFNGINSTANQVANVLLLVEGGFTLATNVSLFQPLKLGKYEAVNRIIAATREKFERIAIVFSIAGIFVALIYSIIVNSNTDKTVIFVTILLTIIPHSINLFFISKYRVILLAFQKEYIINFSTLFTNFIGNIFVFILLNLTNSMYIIRGTLLISSIVNGFIIMIFAKYADKNVNFHSKDSNFIVKGANDVIWQKVTGIIYNSMPVFFISISSLGGATVASIYSVYNFVFVLVKSVLNGFLSAPRLYFGSIASEGNKAKLWEKFYLYEIVSLYIVFITISVTGFAVENFVSLYTKDFTDSVYQNNYISVLMLLIAVFEMLHIPSGHLINMSGKFKAAKYIQVTSSVILIASLLVLGNILGLFGVLISILITSISLFFMETIYVHYFYFERKLFSFYKFIIPSFLIGVLLYFLHNNGSFISTSYISLITYSIASVAFFSIIGMLIILGIEPNLFYLIKKEVINVKAPSKKADVVVVSNTYHSSDVVLDKLPIEDTSLDKDRYKPIGRMQVVNLYETSKLEDNTVNKNE